MKSSPFCSSPFSRWSYGVSDGNPKPTQNTMTSSSKPKWQQIAVLAHLNSAHQLRQKAIDAITAMYIQQQAGIWTTHANALSGKTNPSEMLEILAPLFHASAKCNSIMELLDCLPTFSEKPDLDAAMRVCKIVEEHMKVDGMTIPGFDDPVAELERLFEMGGDN